MNEEKAIQVKESILSQNKAISKYINELANETPSMPATELASSQGKEISFMNFPYQRQDISSISQTIIAAVECIHDIDQYQDVAREKLLFNAISGLVGFTDEQVDQFIGEINDIYHIEL